MCDFELVTLGDNVVLNEGSSITGHYFQDGCLHLKEVGLVTLPESSLRKESKIVSAHLADHEHNGWDHRES